jgi:hypothetical protein
MRRALAALAPVQSLNVPILASTFLFFPLLQAYVQREFEVVVVLALSLALWLLIIDKRGAAAAVLAYAAWFKYMPLTFGVYLGLRRWYRAVSVFLVTSVAIIGIAHLLFGLPQFFNNNVPDHLNSALTFSSEGFCASWHVANTTLANVRWGLCGVRDDVPWFPANVVYLLLCGSIAFVYLATHWRLSRRQLSCESEAWRRALELSIVTTVCACFVFGHYYYLAVLVIPMNVLLTRYLASSAHLRLFLWGVAYFLLSAFVVPTGILSRIFGVNVWDVFMGRTIYLYGELILVALLLKEYWELTVVKALEAMPVTPVDSIGTVSSR